MCLPAASLSVNFLHLPASLRSPSLDFPPTELQNMNDSISAISSNLKAKLRGIAEDLVKGNKTGIDLFDERFQIQNPELRAQIIELLNQYVQEVSDGEKHVEEVDYKRVKRQVKGQCIYCTITSTNDQKGQLFYIGGYKPGMSYCEWATDEEYQKSIKFAEEASRQKQQVSKGKELTNDLGLRLFAQLSAALEKEEPDSCRRADAEYHLRLIAGKNSGFSGSDIEYMLTAWAALELDLPIVT